MNSVTSVPSVAKSIGERSTDNGERPLIPYGRQSVDDDDIAAVVETLRSDWLTQGPRVREFEEAFAVYVGSRYAVAVNSGTAALHLACLAAGLGPGDEVITSPITFVATANCALYVGARPAFVDIDPATFNLDPGRLEAYLKSRPPFTVHRSQSKGRATVNGQRSTSRPRAVIPVHFAGLPCDMSEIHRVAKKFDLVIIEDACHALGAKYRVGREEDSRWISIGSCSHSDMTVFSFHPVKHITTGEGGMVTTNDAALYGRLVLLRNHGITRNPEEFTVHSSQLTVKGNSIVSVGERTTVNGQRAMPPWYYEMQNLGYNYRITDIQCALGRSQLNKIGSFVERRRSIAGQYSRIIGGLPKLRHQTEPDGCQSSYHLYAILIHDEARMSRDEVMAELKRMGVGAQVHYIPVYRHPFYQKLGFKANSWPNAEHFFRHCLSIPMFPGMSEKEIEQVSNVLEEVGSRL
ncbi:MAG: UDP-4-amino-4,6-dideoxy-N-acetyl-beta-L-altrosamine transaminase [Desulfovibrionales bacterium]|nr:UDP-4-amino-4,6-dideoxy-N-acetyl-beta-L-altrosamine transaminase [Desulfovibrionales bacterium]